MRWLRQRADGRALWRANGEVMKVTEGGLPRPARDGERHLIHCGQAVVLPSYGGSAIIKCDSKTCRRVSAENGIVRRSTFRPRLLHSHTHFAVNGEAEVTITGNQAPLASKRWQISSPLMPGIWSLVIKKTGSPRNISCHASRPSWNSRNSASL